MKTGRLKNRVGIKNRFRSHPKYIARNPDGIRVVALHRKGTLESEGVMNTDLRLRLLDSNNFMTCFGWMACRIVLTPLLFAAMT